ncbi:MAG: excinuclease ABC subunit UvrC [Coriobacteriia bacterium]|nr:excinuclease ABC subunit UvrC [Coriobacteriia bacterium]MBS5478858.1 excinuclease ABC subunit UvrC [Coriobacteriia bacterium]
MEPEQRIGAPSDELPADAQADPSRLSLAQQVALVPTDPGCYLWKDAAGKVLYVGKAKNLRARMRQYVTLQDERVKIPLLMEQVRSFEYLVVNSEHEALVLEMNLIRQYDPPFNVDFRDDKSYPYIAITESDLFPAIKFTREKHKAGTRYFGPYTNARAARETIDLARKVVPMCSATCPEWRRITRALAKASDDDPVARAVLSGKGRACFDASVGLGPGACSGDITPVTYRANVRAVERFLAGRRGEFAQHITDEMHEAAAELNFEKAARCRDKLATLKRVGERQQVVFPSPIDMDVIGFYREETIAGAHVLAVREGRTQRSCEFVLDKGKDVSEEELAAGFLKRYYASGADVPDEVDLSVELSDADVLASWLSERHGRKVSVRVPQRGEKRHLLELAEQNARHTLTRFMVRTSYEDRRTNDALLQLESALALPAPPMRIECFDISTIHGRFTVASMVVFTAGKPDTSQYRRFKMHVDTGEANDFLCMQEALGRRYAPERMADERFGSRPDLLILDGGKPQLSAAMQQLGELGLDIPMAGLAKSDEELFVPWDDTPVVLPSGSPSLYLVKQVRDEAHRFAITFHRELRGKAMTVSVLDEIPGVGAKRKRALMKRFGSIKRLREASAADIAATPGVPAEVAREVFETLRAWEDSREQVARAAGLADGGAGDGAQDASEVVGMG